MADAAANAGDAEGNHGDAARDPEAIEEEAEAEAAPRDGAEEAEEPEAAGEDEPIAPSPPPSSSSEEETSEASSSDEPVEPVRVDNPGRREQLRRELARSVPVFTVCALCTGDIHQRTSVMLPRCMHSMHAECFEQLREAADHQPVVCPVCRAAVPLNVTAEAVGHHPLLELQLERRAARPCSMCVAQSIEPPEEAHSSCRGCDEILCPPHEALHRHRPNGPRPSFDYFALGPWSLRCHRHPDQHVNRYCTDCRVPICAKCWQSDHVDDAHFSRPYNAAYVAACRDRLAEAAAALDATASEYLQRNVDVEVVLERIAERDRAALVDLDTLFGRLHELLESRRRQLKAELEERTRAERARLFALRDQNNLRWRILSSTIGIAQDLAQTMPDSDEAAAPVLSLLEPATLMRLTELEVSLPHPGHPHKAVPHPLNLRLDVDDTVDAAIQRIGAWHGRRCSAAPLAPDRPLEAAVDRGQDAQDVLQLSAIVLSGNAVHVANAGAVVAATWIVRNPGNAASWPTGIYLRRVKGAKLSAARTAPVDHAVAPRGHHTFTVSLTAPREPGRYSSLWRLCSPEGHPFGEVLWCTVRVAPRVAEPVRAVRNPVIVRLPSVDDQGPFRYPVQLAVLREIFPEHNEDELKTMLRSTEGNVDDAVTLVLTT